MLTFERLFSERSARRSVRWALALTFVFVTFHLATGGRLAAQSSGSNRSTPSPAANSLRQELENRYEVLPLSDGVLLRPRAERSGVRSIEVSGGSIAINGARVVESVLRAWVGDEDAGPLLRLLALPAAERRAMFGFSAGGPGPATPPSPDAGGSGTADATESPDETVTELPAIPAPPEAPAPPEPEVSDGDEDGGHDSESTDAVRIGTLLRFSGSAHVAADEEADKVVALGGPAIIDGSVRRDVTAIGGEVTVNGRVGRNVLSVGGDVHLGPNAEVEGDVTSVGGTVERQQGAKVHGRINQAGGIGPGIHIGGGDDFDFWPWWSPFAGAMHLMWSLITLAVLGLLVAVTVVVARDPVARVDAKLAGEFWQSGLAGILAQLLFLPLLVVVCFVLAVSIIGIPLLIVGLPLLFLALLLFGLVGFSAFALRAGRLIEHRFDRHFGSAVATALVGLFAIEVCRIFGRLLALGSGPLDLFGGLFSITGLLLTYIAWTFGFGAVILTRFGLGPRRPRGNAGEAPIPGDPYSRVPLDPIPPIPPVDPLPADEKIEEVDSRPGEPGA